VKISAARISRFRLPLAAPLTTAHGVITVREGVLLELGAEGGLRGFGEAMPLAGFGLESIDEANRALQKIARVLIGQDVRDLGGALARCSRVAPLAPAARAAGDAALHDLAARLRGVPIAQLLVGDRAPRARLRISALISAREPVVAAASARERIARGYDTLKIKLGADLDRDLARITAVREAVPRAVRMRLDANGTFDEGEALRALERCARFDPEYVEQPIAARDAASWSRMRSRSPVAVAADEAVCDEASALALLDRGAVDRLILKPAALGGLGAAFRIATRARAFGVGVVVTSFLDSAIGRTAALHLAAAIDGDDVAVGLATGSLLARDLADIPDAARISLPAGVGLGIVPDPVALARCAVGAASAIAA